MRRLHKITNIALIFMLIGMMVCQDAYCLRVPMKHGNVQEQSRGNKEWSVSSSEESPVNGIITDSTEGWVKKYRLDLKSLPVGTLVYLGDTGQSMRDDGFGYDYPIRYIVRIEENGVIKVWLGNNKGCYMGSAELLGSIVSIGGERREFTPGRIQAPRVDIVFPRFEWDVGLLPLTDREPHKLTWHQDFPFFRVLYPEGAMSTLDWLASNFAPEEIVNISELIKMLTEGSFDYGGLYALKDDLDDGDIKKLLDVAMREKEIEIALRKTYIFGEEINFCILGDKDGVRSRRLFTTGRLMGTEPVLGVHNHFDREYLPSSEDWRTPAEYRYRLYTYTKLGFVEYGVGETNKLLRESVKDIAADNLVVSWKMSKKRFIHVIPNTAGMPLYNEREDVYKVITPIMYGLLNEGAFSVVFIDSSGTWVEYDRYRQQYSKLKTVPVRPYLTTPSLIQDIIIEHNLQQWL